jgi:hypothetical protein
MYIYALPGRRCACAAIASALAAIPAYAAELPVTRVILYKHGIAFFERDGAVPAGQEARLDFKSTEMNDVLKSLTVTNQGNGRITGIRYDSNETLEEQLGKFPFKIGDQECLSEFLDRIKGSRIELKSGDRTVAGVIMGARSIETGSDTDKRTVREQITLLADNGDLATYDLAAFASMRLLDARLEEQLTQYLQTLAQAKSREKRSIYIDSAEHASRNLRISYIAPAVFETQPIGRLPDRRRGNIGDPQIAACVFGGIDIDAALLARFGLRQCLQILFQLLFEPRVEQAHQGERGQIVSREVPVVG